MEWYGFLVGTRRYRHHREKGAMHFHSTTYLSFIQSCSKTERHFCILLSYIRLRWPELSCRLFASSYISKVVYFFPNAIRIKPSKKKRNSSYRSKTFVWTSFRRYCRMYFFSNQQIYQQSELNTSIYELKRKYRVQHPLVDCRYTNKFDKRYLV